MFPLAGRHKNCWTDSGSTWQRRRADSNKQNTEFWGGFVNLPSLCFGLFCFEQSKIIVLFIYFTAFVIHTQDSDVTLQCGNGRRSKDGVTELWRESRKKGEKKRKKGWIRVLLWRPCDSGAGVLDRKWRLLWNSCSPYSRSCRAYLCFLKLSNSRYAV